MNNFGGLRQSIRGQQQGAPQMQGLYLPQPGQQQGAPQMPGAINNTPPLDPGLAQRMKRYSSFFLTKDPNRLAYNLNRIVGGFTPAEKQQIWANSGQTTPFVPVNMTSKKNRWANRFDGWSEPDGTGKRYQIGGNPATAGQVAQGMPQQAGNSLAEFMQRMQQGLQQGMPQMPGASGAMWQQQQQGAPHDFRGVMPQQQGMPQMQGGQQGMPLMPGMQQGMPLMPGIQQGMPQYQGGQGAMGQAINRIQQGMTNMQQGIPHDFRGVMPQQQGIPRQAQGEQDRLRMLQMLMSVNQRAG